VGENWRFGKGRVGDVALLKKEGKKHGITVFSAPRVHLNGEPISSSRIRAALEQGDIVNANTMLGYTYFSHGDVQPGKRLGRTLGFPTLNVEWAPQLAPRFGVYVVRVLGSKSTAPLPAVANYGLRPTVEKTTMPRLEVHVLGDCAYDAGDTITVEWLSFLRPELKFSGIGELGAQIARDREEAIAYFSR
jgi:riboflavin kinase/FMN adenylyltransferase